MDADGTSEARQSKLSIAVPGGTMRTMVGAFEIDSIPSFPAGSERLLLDIAQYALDHNWDSEAAALLAAIRSIFGSSDALDSRLAWSLYLSGQKVAGLAISTECFRVHPEWYRSMEIHAALLLLENRFADCQHVLKAVKVKRNLGAFGARVESWLVREQAGPGGSSVSDILRRRLYAFE